MKHSDIKLIVALVLLVLAAGISQASRPGARDATVDPDDDRSILIQTTPMQQPPVFDPYIDLQIDSRLCRLVQDSFLFNRIHVFSLARCAAPAPQTADQQSDTLSERR